MTDDLLEFPKYRIKLEKTTIQDSRPKCKHPDGRNCPAYVNRRCIALTDVNFGDKPCPFFKSVKEMSVDDYDTYKARYKGKKVDLYGNA